MINGREQSEKCKKMLSTLEAVSEQLAEWSLNGGPLDLGAGKVSMHEHSQLEYLERRLEDAIVSAGGKW